MTNNVFGVDLGTCNIKIYDRHADQIYKEKNIIAIANKKDVFAIGDEAFEMYEKAPANINVFFPMNNGVISNINAMQQLLSKFLNRHSKGNLKGSEFIMTFSNDITEVEKKAFHDVVLNSNFKPKQVDMVEKAVADAVGLGVDVKSAKGVMIINIGADTTEIAIISLGGIVISRLIHVGGNQLDEDIQNVLKREYNFYIGDKTAENLKKQLACATDCEESSAKAYGIDVVTGLPVEVDVPASLIFEAISDHLHTIIDSVKIILERTPPELAADIVANGVYVTGGSSRIRNLDKFIRKETNLKANIVDEPEESVVRGLATIIADDSLRSLNFARQTRVYH